MCVVLYSSLSVLCFSCIRSWVRSATNTSRCLLYFSIWNRDRRTFILLWPVILKCSYVIIQYRWYSVIIWDTIQDKVILQLIWYSVLLPGSSSCPPGWLWSGWFGEQIFWFVQRWDGGRGYGSDIDGSATETHMGQKMAEKVGERLFMTECYRVFQKWRVDSLTNVQFEQNRSRCLKEK